MLSSFLKLGGNLLVKEIYDESKDCTLNIFDVEVEVEETLLLDFVTHPELHEAFIEAYPLGEKNNTMEQN